MKKLNSKKGVLPIIAVIFLVAILAATAVYFGMGGSIGSFGGKTTLGTATPQPTLSNPTGAIATNLGDASSVTLNVMDYAGNSVTLQSANLFLYGGKDGDVLTKFIQNQTSSSAFTKATIGKTYYVGTDSASYYINADDVGYAVNDAAVTYEVKGYAVASETSMTVGIYDSQNNELTADDNSNNTADYTYAVGADGKKVLYAKLTNAQADKAFRLGAVCTFAGTNATGTSDYTVTDSRFLEDTAMPKQLKDASITLTNDAASTSTETGYDHCYVPRNEKYFQLLEWEDMTVKTLLEAGSTDPVANGFNEAGILFIDYGCNTNSQNYMQCDYYRHDINARATEVGLSDTTTSPMGLTSGAVVEMS